jgi:hypothetical protein
MNILSIRRDKLFRPDRQIQNTTGTLDDTAVADAVPFNSFDKEDTILEGVH